MASRARIVGSLPVASDASTTSLVFSRGFAVEYDWVADRASPSGQPRRLNALSFPPPFDSDLEGVLRGRGAGRSRYRHRAGASFHDTLPEQVSH